MKINSENVTWGIVLLGDYYKETSNLSKKIWGDWLNYFGITYHVVKMLEQHSKKENYDRLLFTLRDLNHLFYRIYEKGKEMESYPPEVPMKIDCLEASVKSNLEIACELIDKTRPFFQKIIEKVDFNERIALSILYDNLFKFSEEILQINEQRGASES